MKIVYEGITVTYIEHPTDQERGALPETCKQTADELNDNEQDGGGLSDEVQARTRAAAIIRHD